MSRVVLRIRAQETETVELEVLAAFLLNLNLLYEVAIVLATEDASNVDERSFYVVGAARIDQNDRLRVLSISKQSPMEVVVQVGAGLVGLRAFVEVMRVLRTWKLDVRKLELEIQKLEGDVPRAPFDFTERARQKGAMHLLSGASARLEDGPFVVDEVVVEMLPDDDTSELKPPRKRRP